MRRRHRKNSGDRHHGAFLARVSRRAPVTNPCRTWPSELFRSPSWRPGWKRSLSERIADRTWCPISDELGQLSGPATASLKTMTGRRPAVGWRAGRGGAQYQRAGCRHRCRQRKTPASWRLGPGRRSIRAIPTYGAHTAPEILVKSLAAPPSPSAEATTGPGPAGACSHVRRSQNNNAPGVDSVCDLREPPWRDLSRPAAGRTLDMTPQNATDYVVICRSLPPY